MQEKDKHNAEKLFSVGYEEFIDLSRRIEELEQTKPREWNYGVKFLLWILNFVLIAIFAPIFNTHVVERYFKESAQIHLQFREEFEALHNDGEDFSAELKIINLGKKKAEFVKFTIISNGVIGTATPYRFPKENLHVISRGKGSLTLSVGPVDAAGGPHSICTIIIKSKSRDGWGVTPDSVVGGKFVTQPTSPSYLFITISLITLITCLLVGGEWFNNMRKRKLLKKALAMSEGINEGTAEEKILNMFPLKPAYTYQSHDGKHLVYEVSSRKFLFWGKKIRDSEETLIAMLDHENKLIAFKRKKTHT